MLPEDPFRPRPTLKLSWDAVAPFARHIWIHPSVPEDDFDRICQNIWEEAKKAEENLWSNAFEDWSADEAAVREEEDRGQAFPEGFFSKHCPAPVSSQEGRTEGQQNETDNLGLSSQNEEDKDGDYTDFTLPCPYPPGRRHPRGAKHVQVLSPVMETEMKRNEEKAERRRKLREVEEKNGTVEMFLKKIQIPESSGGLQNKESSGLVRPFTAGKPLHPRPMATAQAPCPVPRPSPWKRATTPPPPGPATEGHVPHLWNEEEFPPLPSQLFPHLSSCESEDELDTGDSRSSEDDGDDTVFLPGLRSVASDSSDNDDDLFADDGPVEGRGFRPRMRSAASCVSEDEASAGSPVRELDFSCLSYAGANEMCRTWSREADLTWLPETILVPAKNGVPPPLPKQMPITAPSVPTKPLNITVTEADIPLPVLSSDSEQDFLALRSEKEFPPLIPNSSGLLHLPMTAPFPEKKHSHQELFHCNPHVAPAACNMTAPTSARASVQGKAPGPQTKPKAMGPSLIPPPSPPQQEAYDLLADFPALQPQRNTPTLSLFGSRAPKARETGGNRGLAHAPNQNQQCGASHQRRQENIPQEASSICAGDQEFVPAQAPQTFVWANLHNAPKINHEALKASNQLPAGVTGADGAGVGASAWAGAAKAGMKRAAAPQEKARPSTPEQLAAITTANVRPPKTTPSKETPPHQGVKPSRAALCRQPRPQNPHCHVRPGFPRPRQSVTCPQSIPGTKCASPKDELLLTIPENAFWSPGNSSQLLSRIQPFPFSFPTVSLTAAAGAPVTRTLTVNGEGLLAALYCRSLACVRDKARMWGKHPSR